MDSKWEGPFAMDKPVELAVRYTRSREGTARIVKRKSKVRNEMLLQTQWRHLAGQDVMEILQECSSPEGSIDFAAYKTALVKRCLMAWDIEGVPCSFENFCRLEAPIAMELLVKYMSVIHPPAIEDKKKGE
jgi:hypothetical protein